jgi:hypothetical protein
MTSSGQPLEEGTMYNDSPDFDGGGKRPWFGRKRFGYGYRPQTWQGFLVVGLCVAFIAIVAALTGGHSHWMIVAIIPVVLVTLVARSIGGRR